MTHREEYQPIEQRAQEENAHAVDNREAEHAIERPPSPAPNDKDGESHWNNPENVKNAIHYFAEVRPAEREMMQAGRGEYEARDNRDRADDRGGDKAMDDRKPGREEYKPGSYKPEHDPVERERGGH